MATVIPYDNPATPDGDALKRWVANVQACYFDGRHILDHLVALQTAGGNAAIKIAFGSDTDANALLLFNAVNQTNGYLLNSHDASAVLDSLRPG